MGPGGQQAAERAAREVGLLGAKAGVQAATLALPTHWQPSVAPSSLTSGNGREQRQRTIAIVLHDFLRASSSSAVLPPSRSGCGTAVPLRSELCRCRQGHGLHLQAPATQLSEPGPH